MYLNRKFLIFPIILFLSLISSYIAIHVINNPDYLPYYSLVNSFSGITLNIEPTLGLITYISLPIANIIGIEPTYIVYFFYIFLIQWFLYLAFYNFFKSIEKSFFVLILFLSLYGTIHVLIQIRFGLANSIFLFLYSLFFTRSSSLKFIFLVLLTFFSHFSSVLALFSVIMERLKSVIFSIKSYCIFNIGFAAILIMTKGLSTIYILPAFMRSRISVYLNGYYSVSTSTILIAALIYICLLLTRKSDKHIDSLRMYGAASFLPYIILPEIEIFVRLGTALQYLLIPYFIFTYKSKRFLLSSTLPLLIFFIYKIYSNFSAFLGYLK